jgi:hypothetical protein
MSPKPPHWLSEDNEDLRARSQKRSFDQFTGSRNARMAGTISSSRAQPRQNVVPAIPSVDEIRTKDLKEHFPELRDAEMMPGGILKIFDQENRQGQKPSQQWA